MRDKIKLVSSAGTGHFYTTTKNKRTMSGKFEIKKFDPVVRKHVMYNESKIKELQVTDTLKKPDQTIRLFCARVRCPGRGHPGLHRDVVLPRLA